MAHMLTQMRQTMVQILRDAGTAAGANVWGNRARRFNEGKLPAVHVGTLGRKSADVSDIPEFRHHVQFAVAVVVKSDETADDQAEALLQQVERALFQNPTLNGLSTIPLRPEELQVGMDGEGERVVAVYARRGLPPMTKRRSMMPTLPKMQPRRASGSSNACTAIWTASRSSRRQYMRSGCRAITPPASPSHRLISTHREPHEPVPQTARSARGRTAHDGAVSRRPRRAQG